MYKALHVDTGEEIIILNPLWRQRMEELRALDHADRLVCQGCRQALRVKAGVVKRPHFAHKHLQACSYGSESPEILNARAVLYEWLHRWLGESVTVEKTQEFLNLPRPVDCWVESSGRKAAFWIIEAGLKIEPRVEIKTGLNSLEIPVHYVFLYSMLNEERKEFQSLLLSPTERTFVKTTLFDEMQAGAGDAGGSLHYLNADDGSLTTYRDLRIFHRPNWYKGVKKISPLDDVRPNPLDFGFVHPGEWDRLRAFRQKQQRLEQKRSAYQQREVDWEKRLSARGIQSSDRWGIGRHAGSSGDEPASGQEPEALVCITCGKTTTDYWNTFYDETGQKRCRCRACLDAGLP